MNIHLSLAHINGREQDFIKEAFDENWVTTAGPQISKFEEELQAYIGSGKKVVALSSGTAAIHLGLIRLGVASGDEVICQDFTFVASVNPVRYLGANPVLVGSEPDTWNISPRFLEIAIQERLRLTGRLPKAIVIVDLYGMPCRMEEIFRIADNYGIPVLEDAAEALGSYVVNAGEKKYCGTFGEYGCLSFNGNKIITTSGGGALICPDAEQASDVKNLATQAREYAPHYQHTRLGYNYRLSNVSAAIGRAQMISLQGYVERRRYINQLYRKYLNHIDLEFQNEPVGFYSNFWLTAVLFSTFETREQVRLFLLSNGIESRPLWKPMHLQPLYADVPYYGDDASEQLFEKGLCLPSGSSLSDEEITYVCKMIESAMKSS